MELAIIASDKLLSVFIALIRHLVNLLPKQLANWDVVFDRDNHLIVLYNVFTPTRNVVDVSLLAVTRSTQMREEHEDILVAWVEKYTLNGANAITSMKHKNRYVVPAKVARMHGTITVAMIQCWWLPRRPIYKKHG